MKRTLILTLIAGFAAATACSTVPIASTSSATPLEGKVISENLGKVKGSDSAFSILGLYMIGRPDMDAAMKEALASKGGDALTNVRLYKRWSYFVVVDCTTVLVEAEAVRFAPEKTSPAKGGQR
jgi:hypothetical protein